MAWDPAASAALDGVTPDPDDDPGRGLHPPRRARAECREADPAPGSKYTFFDTIRAAGVDVMQIAPRPTHLDWSRFARVSNWS